MAKIKFSFFQEIYQSIINECKDFYQIKFKNPIIRTIFYGWITFIVFISFSILAGINPFKLLVPFSVFSLPLKDGRSLKKIYISDGETKLIETNRLLFFPSDLQDNIREIIEEVGRTPQYSINEENWKNWNTPFKKLPNLTPALKVIWIQKDGKEIILDFIKEIVDKELSKYTNPSEWVSIQEIDEDNQDTKSYYKKSNFLGESPTKYSKEERIHMILSLTTKAIVLSIKANHPQVENVLIYMDGKPHDDR